MEQRAWQRWAFRAILLTSVLLFGGLVQFKTVSQGQGDQDVYFRAAWAIRQGGADLYHVTDHHGWHYHYPPLFAILLTPLAHPGELPRPVLIAILYLVNVACLALGIWVLVGMLPATQRHRWPIAVLCCLPAIGLTLVRGQVDTILLVLLAGFAAALAKKRSGLAGLCLAAAIAVKIIPAFLLLVPLWRRDGRCLLGCAIGLFVGLWLIPALVLGPARTHALYAKQLEVLIKPALHLNDDRSRGTELLDARITTNQSFQMVVHQLLYFGRPDIPRAPTAWVRLLHVALTLALMCAVLWRWDRRSTDPLHLLTGLALLMALMILASPVCHLHYFTLLLPLALVLAARPGWPAALALFVLLAALGLPMLPGLGWMKELGVPLFAALFAGGVGWQERRFPRESGVRELLLRAA